MDREEKRIQKNIYNIIWILYFSFLFIRGNIRWTEARIFPVIIIAIVIIDRLSSYKKEKNLLAISFSFKEIGLALWYIPFAIWVFVSRNWSMETGLASSGIGIEIVCTFFMLLAMDVYVQHNEDVYTIINGYSIGATIYGAFVFITSPVSSYGNLEFGKATNMQRNSTGYVLLFGTIFCLVLYYYYKRNLYIGAALICFVTSLLTGSRKIIFAYGVAVFIWLFSQNDLKENIKLIGKIVILGALIFPLAYQIPFIKETFGERLLAVVDDSIYDSSIFYRNMAKEIAIELFKSSPIIGHGWNAVKMSFHYNDVAIYAHNNYLEIAADFGIIGVMCYYWRSFLCLISGIVNIRFSKEVMIKTIIIVCILLLDWGQVSFLYRFMVCTLGIVYKYNDFVVKTEDA